ncbi:MAG TPA: DUF2786 domain-containing protein [Solirubrobacteraceae bacterium]|nr:DUF2786 domain-containing protein [Solirubrobacteraceae bacterium]
MTRDRAIDRVTKLRTITVERGATRHEAAAAAALAAQLTARHALDAPPPGRGNLARYSASARTDRRSARSLRFVAFA